MDTIITILITSVLTGVVASYLTSWFTRKNLKTTKYIDTVTTNRLNWINMVRDDLTELVSSLLIHQKNKIEDTEIDLKKTLTRNEIVNKAILLKLIFNPIDDEDIIKQLEIIMNNFADYSNTTDDINIDISTLIELSQKILKNEWDKIKLELNIK